MTAALSITVDVDGPTGLACRPIRGGWASRLSSRSEAQYGLTRGVPRLLDALAESAVAGTFYVPGAIAAVEPALVREIRAAGHEVAHHGHDHLPSVELSDAEQREELLRGIAAHEDSLGARPAGYRSPAWELTPATLHLLPAFGFAYDSSLMGDDRPYRLDVGGAGIVELPVHWSLDDVPWLAFHPEAPARLSDGAGMLTAWIIEADAAAREERHVTYTVHPEVSGRPHRVELLRRLLDHAAAVGVPAVTHRDAAART